MIALLSICLYIFLTTVAVGFLVFRLLERFFFKEYPGPSPSVDILSIIGLVTLGALLNYYSLFFKIGDIYPHLFIISLAILSIAAFPHEWKRLLIPSEGWALNWRFVGLILLFITGIIHYSVQAPKHYDTSLYHAQAIQWIEKYACVPGLGNLHGRLAINSSFLVISAFYGFSFLGGQTYYAVNPYLVTLLTFSILMHIRKSVLLHGDYQRAFILLFIFVVFYSMLLGDSTFSPTSPSTDIIPVVLITYLFIATSRTTALLFDKGIMVLMAFVPVFLITVKLSQIPIMIFTAGLLFGKTLNLSRRLILAAVPSVLILLPWLLRNIILSGYLVYPLPQLDLFSFDWKVPHETAFSENQWIKSWAIIPFKHYHEVLPLSIKTWFFPWFGMLLQRYKMLLVVTAISPVIIGLAITMGKIRKELAFFWLVCFIGCVFWFVNAPDVRFAFGFILYSAAIPLSLFVGSLKKLQPTTVYRAVIVVLVIGVIRDVILPGKRTCQRMGTSQAKELLWKPDTLKEVAVTYEQARNIIVSKPVKEDQCSINPLPCTPYFNPNLQLRGNGLQSGFRIAPL